MQACCSCTHSLEGSGESKIVQKLVRRAFLFNTGCGFDCRDEMPCVGYHGIVLVALVSLAKGSVSRSYPYLWDPEGEGAD
jgi:hypothetical protein